VKPITTLFLAGSMVVGVWSSIGLSRSALTDAPGTEEWERQVIALIQQLGNERFDEREAAHRARLKGQHLSVSL
jgi:hypothetical protein